MAYIILGMIVAVFFTEHELPKEKCKRSALIMGLLAPSVLIAIVSKPVGEQAPIGNLLDEIPKITSIFLIDAYAQEGAKPASKAADDEPRIVVITKKDVDLKFGEAFLKAVGREKAPSNYTFVVGTTTEEPKALKAASKWNIYFKCRITKDCARVIAPKGSKHFFVTVGSFQPAKAAYETKQRSLAVVLEALKTAPDSETVNIAGRVAQGKVVQGLEFFQ